MTGRDLNSNLGVIGGDPAAMARPRGAHRQGKSGRRDADPQAIPGRQPGPGTDGASPKGRRGRSVAALVVVVVMLGGLGGGVWYGGSKVLSIFGTPDYAGAGSGTVTVQILPGDTASDVARALAKAGVIKSPKAFVSVAQGDPRSTSLQPGIYQLRKQMKASVALELLFDPAARLQARVTLPEGLSVVQSLERISLNTGIALAELTSAAKDTTKLGLPAYAAAKPGQPPSLEGFLYPATYELEPGISALTILRTMVAKFKSVTSTAQFDQRAKAAGVTSHQALVIASMVQREGRAESDNPKIARVIFNRLARDMPLEIDATVLYGLGRYSGPLSQADLDKVTPYNTRRVKGLPPTPIASPGEAAIAAALAPAKGNWLYYVIKDKQGHHLFTADYDAFLAQKAKSQREGLI